MNHIGTIRLETDRLILRRFTMDDAEGMLNNWASDDEVTKYLTWPTHQNIETTMAYIDYCMQEYAKSAFYQWIIEIKETQELIGNISVVKVIDETDSLELGWVIGRKYWGKGYTAEAARVIIEGRVMQKIGMKYEGTLRQSNRNNQGIVDSARYSILRSER